MAYTVTDPHPMYGKDPNLLNEMGHTAYPKWIDHPTEKDTHPVTMKEIAKRVLVQDAKEEAEILGTKAKNWNK